MVHCTPLTGQRDAGSSSGMRGRHRDGWWMILNPAMSWVSQS